MDDIKKYVLEKKLNVSAEQFFNYFSEGNWIDSKGNQVKNWKQKILTWNGYSNKNNSISKEETEEEKKQRKIKELKEAMKNDRR